MEIIMGGTAAMFAGVFTNPVEVVKIRMQLQGELKARGQYTVHYRNFVHAAYTIAKNEGVLALQKGLVPALWFQFIMNGTRLGLYDRLDKAGVTRNRDGTVNILHSLMVGAVAGIAGATLSSPIFLVKTHLQSKANVEKTAVGYQHDHRGMVSALTGIYKKFGIPGLFRGVSSSIPRVTVGSSMQLASFEKSIELVRSSNFLRKDNRWGSAFLASLISGLLITCAQCPFDLVSTRYYNQGVDEQGRGLQYRTMWDCARKVFQSEGVYGFCKGFVAMYVRSGPHTVLSLICWDELKHYYQLYKTNS